MPRRCCARHGETKRSDSGPADHGDRCRAEEGMRGGQQVACGLQKGWHPEPTTEVFAVNAAVVAGPAISPMQGTNPAQAAVDMPAGELDVSLPEGAFKDVLEKRLQSGNGLIADKFALATDDPEVVSDPSALPQLIDSNRLTNEAVVAFLALQPTSSLPAAPAGGGTVPDPLLPVAARVAVAEWTPPKGLAAATVLADRGAGEASDVSAEPDPRAAIGAGTGKPLPPTAAGPGASFRSLLAEAAVASRPVDTGVPLPVAVDTPPASAAGGAPVSGTAQGMAQPADVRVASTQVAVPFGRPEWTNAMNERVTWLVGQRMQSADIQINPPQLGPVEVRITIQNDQANVFFTSHNGAVREAIQAALPRLNEMLAQGGLSLGQTSVGAESFAGQHQASRDGNARRQDHDLAGGLPATQAVGSAGQPAVTMLRGRVGIDMFV